jgi:hypothetical protein
MVSRIAKRAEQKFPIARRAMRRDYCGISQTVMRIAREFHIARREMK